VDFFNQKIGAMHWKIPNEAKHKVLSMGSFQGCGAKKKSPGDSQLDD